MKKIFKRVAANIAALATTIKVAVKETISRGKSWVKDHKINTALIMSLVVIIVILVALLLNNKAPESNVQENINDVPVVEVIPSEENSDGEPEKKVDQKSTYSGVNPQDKKFRDLEDEKTSSVEKTEEKIEGTKETFDEQDVENDPESSSAKQEIADEIEEEKVQEELESDPQKDVVSDPNDKATVVGDDNTGKNDNVVKPEDPNLPSPFDDVEDLVSEESKPQNDADTTKPEDSDNSEVVPETEKESPSDDGVYDLFPEDESSDEEIVEPEVDEENDNVDDVIEDTTDESNKNDSEVVEQDDKTEDNTEVAPEDSFIEDFQEEAEPEIHVEDTTPSTPAEDEVKDVPAEFFSTYIKATGTVATLNLTAGRITSADAGEGVKVTINNNVIVVELETVETTTVEVIMTDSLGNQISAIVAFEN